MSFQVGIGSLGGTVFFQVGLCTPLQTMELYLRKAIVPCFSKGACLFDKASSSKVCLMKKYTEYVNLKNWQQRFQIFIFANLVVFSEE